MEKRKLLVVVDMQNDFVDGVLGTAEAQTIIPAVVKKIESYKANENYRIYDGYTYRRLSKDPGR